MGQIIDNIISILIMNGTIMLIPGVNFLIVAQHSLLNGLRAGLSCALGIATAIILHASFAAYSVNVLLERYPLAFMVIRCLGAAYLFYLGTRFLVSYMQNQKEDLAFDNQKTQPRRAFQSGFFIDLLNPFISIFYLSLFSTLIMTQDSTLELSYYLSIIFLLNGAWFSIVALLFNHSFLKKNLEKKSKYIQGFSGIAMYYFCAKIVISVL